MTADTSTALAMIRGDSARAVATIYTMILLATAPLVAAAIGSVLLRRASAGARLLLWRSAVVALLFGFLGRAVPLHSLAWVVPRAIAAPLVALGRVQVTAGSFSTLRSLVVGAPEMAGAASYAPTIVQALIIIYVAGVIAVLIPTVTASMRVRRSLRDAARISDLSWRVDEISRMLGIRRRVRLFISPTAAVPMTWGVLAPVVVLPAAAMAWSAAERRIVLLHELTHVRAADWLFNLTARAACALYWFHPGAWLLARALREECELACDDRVVAAGTRRSDYAELLVKAADALRPNVAADGVALALSHRGGLRARLAAVLDVRHDTRPIARGWATVATVATVAVACPMSIVHLAPTRDVLTTLMADARWESRAYAVIGLAERRDSVAVARSAAERDPSPRVRAWARYALGQTADLPTDNARPNRPPAR